MYKFVFSLQLALYLPGETKIGKIVEMVLGEEIRKKENARIVVCWFITLYKES